MIGTTLSAFFPFLCVPCAFLPCSRLYPASNSVFFDKLQISYKFYSFRVAFSLFSIFWFWYSLLSRFVFVFSASFFLPVLSILTIIFLPTLYQFSPIGLFFPFFEEKLLIFPFLGQFCCFFLEGVCKFQVKSMCIRSTRRLSRLGSHPVFSPVIRIRRTTNFFQKNISKKCWQSGRRMIL